MLLQIHDELIFECLNDDLKYSTKWLRSQCLLFPAQTCTNFQFHWKNINSVIIGVRHIKKINLRLNFDNLIMKI